MGEFNFGHLHNPAAMGDSVHFHAYEMGMQPDRSHRLALRTRLSTGVDGVGQCLGLQAEARIELEQIIAALQAKISAFWILVWKPVPRQVAAGKGHHGLQC
ncbi:hypothetical protein [Pseudoxanthomonas mexicana]